MKPTRDQDIEVQSTVTGDVARMSIDADAMQHIMAILTDLYSDPELAVIREYSTNALDAHIEAGNTAPIEVTTPSALSPFLTIKDHGIGLSVEDIHRIYSQYGASTKRGTNEQVGMLGLGCKSALTYTSQFTVTSRKDGVKISVAVSRDDDGGGSMTVVDTRSTDEPNGVEVSIPARRGNEMHEKAAEFFRHWREGTVLLNGQPPERDSGLWLTPDLCVVKDENRYRYDRTPSKVVMGNVAYPVEGDYLDWLPYRLGLVAYVPIGSVNFTPSREALHYTSHTKATLAGLRQQYEAAVPGAIQREVDKAADHAAALAVVASWAEYLTNSSTVDFTFKGDTLPSEYEVKDASARERPIKGTPAQERYGKLSGCSSLRSVPASSWPSCVWIYNYTPAQVDANQKRKMMKHVEDHDLEGVNQFILLTANADPSKTNKFIDPARCVSWETVRSYKLATTAAHPYREARIPGSYDVYTWDTPDGEEQTRPEFGNVQGDDIRLTNVFYIWGNKWAGQRTARDLALHYPQGTLVCLPQNRIQKFKRDCPIVVEASEAIEAKKQEWLDTLDPQVAEAMFMDGNYTRSQYLALDPDRIDDPELQRLARVARVKTTEAEAKARSFGWRVPQPANWQHRLRDEYPLADGGRLTRQHADHVYVYINAVYAASQKESE